MEGTFRIYSLTDFGGLTSRGSQTTANRGWSQFTGRFRAQSQDPVYMPDT